MIAVLTCDIIASRTYTDVQRQALDTKLRSAFKAACQALPQAHADYLSFSIIQGDEFQFSLQAPRFFYHFLLILRNLFALCGVHPLPLFRSGIGWGTCSIASSSNSYQRDGSAYHNSRSALNSFELPNNKQRLSSVCMDNPFVANSFNTILMFCDNIELGWSERQRFALTYALQANSIQETANKMGVSRQNVEKLLKSAKWDLITESLGYFTAADWIEADA